MQSARENGQPVPFSLLQPDGIFTHERVDTHMSIAKKQATVRHGGIAPAALIAAAVGVFALVVLAFMTFPSVAMADIKAGDTVIHGYNPSDIVSTDVEVADGDIDAIGPFLTQRVVSVVIKGLPILAVLSVCVLIYNAVRNMFLPDEDPHEAMKHGRKPKRPMGQVLKDIFMMYFWILFAWIIVELIIYAVTHMETMFTESLSTSPSQQTTTQQVQQQQQPVTDSEPAPVGGTTDAEAASEAPAVGEPTPVG